MKKKKSFSKTDYYLLLFEEYKDQFTLVLCINMIFDFIISHLGHLYKSIYFKNNFDTTFINATQFDMSMFLEVIGYIYLASFFLHLLTYKANKYWIFLLNSTILVIISNLLYLTFTFNDVLLTLKQFHWPLIMCIIGQFLLNCVWMNEMYQLIQQKIISNSEHT